MEKTKIWTDNTLGGDLFEADTAYLYELPGDFETWVSIEETEAPRNLKMYHQVDNERRLAVWWSGGNGDLFQARIILNYKTISRREKVLSEPWSSMADPDSYAQKARKLISRTYRTWPVCDLCKAEKQLITVQENVFGSHLTITVYLECKC